MPSNVSRRGQRVFVWFVREGGREERMGWMDGWMGYRFGIIRRCAAKKSASYHSTFECEESTWSRQRSDSQFSRRASSMHQRVALQQYSSSIVKKMHMRLLTHLIMRYRGPHVLRLLRSLLYL